MMEGPSSEDSLFSFHRDTNKASSTSISIESSTMEEDTFTNTSGCSSNISGNMMRLREKKKERVKQCLRELKSLLPAEKQWGGKTGTLSALQHVINHMKKMKDTQNTSNLKVDTELLGCIAEESQDLGLQIGTGEICAEKERYLVVVSLQDSQVIQVPDELLDLLGYPKRYWAGQAFLDYVYKRDVVTVSSNISVSHSVSKHKEVAPGETTDQHKNVFFFRLRHYKSLRQGYSISRPEKYTVFCGQARVQKLSIVTPANNSPSGMFQQPERKYMVIECMVMKPAYSEPNSLPQQRSFSTRHTVYCNYNFIHPQAISLLGYLPQDMVGTSVFEYCHPDDMGHLLEIYQQVVARPGKTVKSQPYRMQAKNGDYVDVETEWSSFVNPWTKRLDFIMGQHQIIKGPTNLDVFAENTSRGHLHNFPAFTQQARAIQRKIKQLLLQVGRKQVVPSNTILAPPAAPTDKPVAAAPATTNRAPSSTVTSAQVTEEPAEGVTEESISVEGPATDTTYVMSPVITENAEDVMSVCSFVEQAAIGLKQQLDTFRDDAAQPASPHQSSIPPSPQEQLVEEDMSTIYQQLNYAQNICRFLTGCQSNDGSEKTKKSSSPSEEEEDPDSDGQITMEMELPSLPRPPSFASSTKALVSEHEQREDLMPPSPEVFTGEDHNQKEDGEDDKYRPVTLTEEVLMAHTKLQEQNYIHEVSNTKPVILLPSGKQIQTASDPKSCKRRLLVSTNLLNKTDEDVNKMMRQEDGKAVPTSWSPGISVLPHMQKTPQSLGAPPTGGKATQQHTQQTQPAQSQIGPTTESSHGTPVTMGTTQFVGVNNLQGLGSNLLYSQGIPMMSVDQHPQTKTLMSFPMAIATQDMTVQAPSMSQTGLGGLQWPYYPQTGVQFMPQIMGGFYQPIPGLFQQFPSQHMMGQNFGTGAGVSTNQSSGPMVQQQEKTGSAACKEAVGSSDQVMCTSPGSKVVGQDKGGTAMLGHKNMETSDSSNSLEETSSSLQYLLELDSGKNNYSSNSEDIEEDLLGQKINRTRTKLLPKDPPWVREANWSEDVAMRYTMPTWDTRRVLREDRKALKKMMTPHTSMAVLEQLQEILEQVTTHTVAVDEETDAFFILEGKDSRQDSKADTGAPLDTDEGENRPKLETKKSSQLLPDTTFPSCVSDTDTTHKESIGAIEPDNIDSFRDTVHSEFYLPDKNDGKKSDDGAVESNNVNSFRGTDQNEFFMPNKNDIKGDLDVEMMDLGDSASLPQGSPDSGVSGNKSPEPIDKVETGSFSSEGKVSSVGMINTPDKAETGSDTSEDACSKGSSELTPSDQRSHEEIGSSLKESDGASSSGDSNDKSRKKALQAASSDSESEQASFSVDELLVRLFVPLRLRYKHCVPQYPSWLRDVKFNNEVQMHYFKGAANMDSVLARDREQMEGVTQPTLVQQQLSELVQEIVAAKGTATVDQVDENRVTSKTEVKDSGEVQMETDKDRGQCSSVMEGLEMMDALFRLPGSPGVVSEQTQSMGLNLHVTEESVES